MYIKTYKNILTNQPECAIIGFAREVVILKLSEYAKKNSITYQTAWNHFKQGKIPNARQLPSGTVVIDEPAVRKTEYTVVYARISAEEEKQELESQCQRICEFCAANGWNVNEIVKECGSSLNEERPKLSKIFHERKATRIVIESKNRLTRFGWHYIKLLYPECDIVVLNEREISQEILEDFISLTSEFCTKIYGKSNGAMTAEKIVSFLKQEKINKGR